MIELWEENTDAINNLNTWRSWVDERCPGMLESLEDEANLYGLMCEIVGELRRLRELRDIVTDAAENHRDGFDIMASACADEMIEWVNREMTEEG